METIVIRAVSISLFMKSDKILDESKILGQLSLYGFLPEDLPSCFSSKLLSENIELFINQENKNHTAPTSISYFKSETSRRVMCIPNPKSFIEVIVFIKNNWEKIKSLTESENSLSPIVTMSSYNAKGWDINSKNLQRKLHSKSNFEDSTKDRINISMGYKYCLRTDISKFYDTVYTHSIAWAVCGKDRSKKQMLLKQNERSHEYNWADTFDKLIRYQKNNETNGIITGPFSSRIFSEIILVAIDNELVSRGFVFTRYVDDYQFYFESNTEAESKIPEISLVLKDYGLNLNEQKTTIALFPYGTYVDLSKELKVSSGTSKEILNKSIVLQNQGEKGACKYAVKCLYNLPLEKNEADVVIPLMVNLMFTNPNLGTYVVEYLKRNESLVDKDAMCNLVNKKIPHFIENTYQQETLMMLYLAKSLSLRCEPKNIISVIGKGDDFSTIISLDLWKTQKHSESKDNVVMVEESISELKASLEKEGYESSRWLLIHEAKMHNLMDLKNVNDDSFFDKLKSNGVSFYVE